MKPEYEGVKIVLTKKFVQRPPTHDYMKFYRVIRYYAKDKYNIGTADIDMLFFLAGEGLFSYRDFDEYSQLCGWDEKRFRRLKKEGWIRVWREYIPIVQGKLFTISVKGKNAVNHLYEVMDSGKIPENTGMFKKNVPFNDKVYRNFIRRMNKKVRANGLSYGCRD